MIIDPDTLDPRSRYKLLVGSVVPRPIAWTSTINGEGVPNLAPFSFFTVASRNPAMLCISVGPRVDRPPDTKDTLNNIVETEEFVINIVSVPLSNAMHESSMNHPPEADEFEKAGLTPAGCEVVGAPRVEEAAVSMECVLERVLKLGTDHLVIGKMVRFHVREELYENGRIDIAKRTIRVGRFFPSTKLCSECGRLNPNLTLSERAWLCGCGAQHDRDLNAAKNILAEGMRLLAAGQTESPINARGGPVSLPTGSTA